MTRWAILTGEYPPQPGGVSDYTRLVAAGLAAAGDAVAVFAPPHRDGKEPDDPGVLVRRLPGHFGPRALAALDAALSRRPRPDRILVQYVPHAYGWKGMNVPFAAWVSTRAKRLAPAWVMFHEVAAPFGPRPAHALLGAVTRVTARLVAGVAARVFVSIPAWGGLLKTISPRARPAEWLPVPATVPPADAGSVAAVRARVSRQSVLIGHFGTFGHATAPLLKPVFTALLHSSPGRAALLVGRESARFREAFTAAHPDLADRVTATGHLSAGEVAAHLAACDLLVQPYSDGASTRRTTLMAGLALGVPTVTNRGALSEPIWGRESPGVTVAPSPDPAGLVAAAGAVLALTPAERAARGAAAAAWYRSEFALERTVARLREEAS